MGRSALGATLLVLAAGGAPAQRVVPDPVPAAAPAPQPASGPRGRGAGAVLKDAVASLDRVAHARETQKATERYDPLFKKYTKRFFGPAADWRMFKAQGMAESDLRPDARSRVGARGIMQLMPSTYKGIQSKRPEFGRIDDPEWNIAAGIMHDRYLWTLWDRRVHEQDRWEFMFASYNAGQGTISRARRTAAAAQLDSTRWWAIENVAPKVQRWRYRETLGYVKKIRANRAGMR